MRILIFGASGATGRVLVEQALTQNHAVTAFVRNPAKLGLTHERLNVFQGDVADATLVDKAIPGHDAVLSTLGVGKPLNRDPVVIDGVRRVVQSMQRHGVRRLIYLSFIGVPESRPAAGFLIRHVARFPLRHEIADHEVKEALVRGSDLDWTIVRPPKLTDGAGTGQYRVGVDIVATSFFPTLARADVAAFMLGQLTDTTYTRMAPRLLP